MLKTLFEYMAEECLRYAYGLAETVVDDTHLKFPSYSVIPQCFVIKAELNFSFQVSPAK